MLGSIDHELECDFNFVGDVLAADLVLAEAESTALARLGRALAPADGTNAVGVVLAGWVAKCAALFLILVADQRSASRAAV